MNIDNQNFNFSPILTLSIMFLLFPIFFAYSHGEKEIKDLKRNYEKVIPVCVVEMLPDKPFLNKVWK